MPSPTTFDPAHSGTNVVLSSGNLGCRPVAQQNSSRATNGWTMSGTQTVQWQYKYTVVDPICAPSVGIAIDGDTYDGNGLNGYAPTCSQSGYGYSDNDVGGGAWYHAGIIHGLGAIAHPIGGGQIPNGVILCVLDPVGLTLAIYRVPWNGASYNAPQSVYTITGLTAGLKIYPTLGQGNANGPGSPTSQAWLANFGASPFAASIGDISYDHAVSPSVSNTLTGQVGGIGSITDAVIRCNRRVNGTSSGSGLLSSTMATALSLSGSVSGGGDVAGGLPSHTSTARPLTLPVVIDRVVVVRIGQSMRRALRATNNPLSWIAYALPTGLSIDRHTGEVHGVPSAAGSWNVALRVGNDDGDLPASVRFIVLPDPPTVSWTPAAASLGLAYSDTPTVSGAVDEVAVTGLPTGLAYDSATGDVTGASSEAGEFSVTLTATGPGGQSSVQATLTVDQTVWTLVETIADTYQTPPATAGAYTAVDLPGWLSLNGSTGVVTGTAPRGSAGDYDVSLSYGGVLKVVLRVHVQALKGPVTPYTSSGSSSGMRRVRVRDNSLR